MPNPTLMDVLNSIQGVSQQVTLLAGQITQLQQAVAALPKPVNPDNESIGEIRGKVDIVQRQVLNIQGKVGA